MNFYNHAGKMALGSRLRRLSELVTEDAANVYKLYGIEMNPKWFPVFYILSFVKKRTITEIASDIGHSHPSVIKTVREMHRKGYLTTTKDKADARKNIVSLSEKGIRIKSKIQNQYTDVNNAIKVAIKEANHNLWDAIEEWETVFQQKSLLQRVEEQKKIREMNNVEIVNFHSKFSKVFKELNVEWITKYFKVEQADIEVLNNPQKNIINKGGYIFIALYNKKPVGVCALVKMNNSKFDFELSKMAVRAEVQGKGIGWLLGKAVIDKAKALGAKNIFLESNTVLMPAINLYKKLGFKEISGINSPYERTNIQMELILSTDGEL